MVDYTTRANRQGSTRHDRERSDGSVAGSLFRPTTFAAVTSTIIAALVVLSSLAHLLATSSDSLAAQLVLRAFSLDREQNLPTFAAFVLLVLAAVLTAMVGWRHYRAQGRWWRHWCALAVLMLFIAYDEAAIVHERLNEPVRTYFDVHGMLYFAWVIPGVLIVALLTVIFLPFVRALPIKASALMVAAAGCYVMGALGMELVGSSIYSGGGHSSAVYYAAMTAEETLEMTGLMLFCTAMLSLRRSDDAARA